MNRFVVFGIAIFFAVVGIALLGGESRATAGLRCHGCNGCHSKCDGCHSKCDGCHSRCHGCHSRCHGCHSKCHGCHSKCHGCHGGLFHRCHGCHSCSGCNGCEGKGEAPVQKDAKA